MNSTRYKTELLRLGMPGSGRRRQLWGQATQADIGVRLTALAADQNGSAHCPERTWDVRQNEQEALQRLRLSENRRYLRFEGDGMKNHWTKSRHKLEFWLWHQRPEQMTTGQRLLWRFCRVLYAVVRDMVVGTLSLHAMSLVYTTLLSVVPLLALSFSVLKALGVHNQFEPALFSFFEPLGPQGHEIAENILGFVDNVKVGVLGFLGLGLLIYTVISLVQKVERAFNEIWRVSELRSIAQRFSNYLSVIVIGPVLSVSAIGLTATIVASDLVQSLRMIEPFGSLFALLSSLVPYFLITGAFTFVYCFIPNTRVSLPAALAGGAIAGLAWQTTGLIFASFVVGSSKYEAIYSGFAVGILALIWLYLNWLILLLGSAITFYMQHSEQITERLRAHSSAEVEEKAALQIMYWVAKAFDQGEDFPIQKLPKRLGMPADLTRRLLNKLIHHNLLTLAGADAEALVPARSLDQIRVEELFRAIRRDDDRLFRPQSGMSQEPKLLWQQLESDRNKALANMTLAQLVRQQEVAAEPVVPTH